MNGKAKLPILIIGLGLYIFDVASDVYVAVQYCRTDQWWWFGLTLTFIIVPATIINIASLLSNYTVGDNEIGVESVNELRKTGPLCMASLTFCSCSFIFSRFYEEILHLNETYMDPQPCGENYQSCTCQRCKSYLERERKSIVSAYRSSWIRYLETVCESAPQWCLQVYIMLRQEHFPWYTILSTVISLVALAWSITSLEKARQAKNDNKKFNFCFSVVFLIWQLSFLISRLSAIVYCAYVLRYYVFIIIGINWLLASIVLIKHQQLDNIGIKTIIVGWMLSYPFIFNISEPLHVFRYSTENPRRLNIIMTTIFALMNILMLVLGITVSISDLPHKKEVTLIAIPCVVGGLVLGIFACVLYYKICPASYPGTLIAHEICPQAQTSFAVRRINGTEEVIIPPDRNAQPAT